MELNLHDKLVLENIFNPNLPFGDPPNVDQELENSVDLSFDTAGDHDDLQWKKLESEGVQLAEKEEFDAALELFNQAVELQPEKAASYNNRAQVLRLKGDVEAAKADLEIAIEKSEGVGAVGCQAFTQRAMIRRLQGDDEGCRADFKKAADLGSKFAKQQLVALNPYAALCNQMLSQMMNQARTGESANSRDPAA